MHVRGRFTAGEEPARHMVKRRQRALGTHYLISQLHFAQCPLLDGMHTPQQKCCQVALLDQVHANTYNRPASVASQTFILPQHRG